MDLARYELQKKYEDPYEWETVRMSLSLEEMKHWINSRNRLVLCGDYRIVEIYEDVIEDLEF